MIIHQFYDTGLAHASYAIIRDAKMIVIDPSRDPQTYYDFAQLHEADIVGVIETHPHADFVSSHLELHQNTGAIIYCSKLIGAAYPHESFDDGDIIHLADIKLKAINTPAIRPILFVFYCKMRMATTRRFLPAILYLLAMWAGPIFGKMPAISPPKKKNWPGKCFIRFAIS
jgi:hypothetical protein